MSLAGRRKLRIGDVLLNDGVITQEKLDEALAIQQQKKKRLGEVLIEDGFITDDVMANALSRQLGYDRANMSDVSIPSDLIAMFDIDIL